MTLIEQAAVKGDVHEAAKMIQGALGITDGALANLMLPDSYTWRNVRIATRFESLGA